MKTPCIQFCEDGKSSIFVKKKRKKKRIKYVSMQVCQVSNERQTHTFNQVLQQNLRLWLKAHAQVMRMTAYLLYTHYLLLLIYSFQVASVVVAFKTLMP